MHLLGAIGDVDGDGTLDLVSIATLSGRVTDPWGGLLRVVKQTKVTKVNLVARLRAGAKELVPVEPTNQKASYESGLELRVSEVKLRPMAAQEQPWTAYLGTQGDSAYHRGGH